VVTLPPQAGAYHTVYADPPWLERGGGRIKRGADKHYRLMSTKAIAALPVREWAAKDAHLYLWVTNNFLPDGLLVLGSWGFRYVTAITWMKDKVGLGQYYRGITEHCLFGVRGRVSYRFRPDGKRAQGKTGFLERRGSHSVKPETMRQMIEVVSPGPYLEICCTRPTPDARRSTAALNRYRPVPPWSSTGASGCRKASERHWKSS